LQQKLTAAIRDISETLKVLTVPYTSLRDTVTAQEMRLSMQIDKTKVALLVYLSRSGSTLLARELSKYNDVFVSIEANLPRFNKLQRIFGITKDPESYIKQLYADPKFRAWGIASEQVRAALKDVPCPPKLEKALAALLPLAANNHKASVYVFKIGDLFFKKQFYTESEQLSVIFISRDPRGIFASQKRALDSREGRPMACDIVRFAASYRLMHEKLNRFTGPLHHVRYEDLVSQPEDTLKGILRFLKVDTTRRASEHYYSSIPQAQKHLHTNLADSRVLQGRAQAWRYELTKEESQFLQLALKREMLQAGYAEGVLRNLPLSELSSNLARNLFRFHLVCLRRRLGGFIHGAA
jgi:hypothetical protein